MCNSGISSAAIVLVLFILLIIILGAYIQPKGGGLMSCQNSCQNKENIQVQSHGCTHTNNFNFVIALVLYILLAIIIGTWIW